MSVFYHTFTSRNIAVGVLATKDVYFRDFFFGHVACRNIPWHGLTDREHLGNVLLNSFKIGTHCTFAIL